jgi:hypothetical protein
VQCMLFHDRLPDIYPYHALLHVCNVFSIPPLKGLVTADSTVTTTFDFFVGSKPIISHFKVFECS